MRTLTKDSRINSRNYQFSKLIEAGYLQETYKSLDFFTANNGQYFTLKVFKGTAANHIEYVNYRTLERRNEVIQRYKDSYENNLKYKEEQKIKNKGKLSSHAAAAAAIKAELTSLYPYVKFSAKSESFSMGDSVHVSWEDGPTTKEVDEIIGKYQYGHFNGMDDLYENTNSRSDIPQSKYVNSGRGMSEQTEAILLPDAERLFVADRYSDVRSVNDFLRRVFYHSSIPANATIIGIIPTGESCGISTPETFYKVGYTLPEGQQKTEPENITPIEAVNGEINIVDYSEKAFAVIGTPEDLKLLQSKMYELGGKYNKYLKCGAGYIFSKKKLDEVTKALSENITTEAEEPKQPQILELAAPPQPEIETVILPTPQTNVFKLDYFKIIWHEGHQNPNFENTTFYNWIDTKKAFVKLWEVNERGQNGGYTKVKCEIKFLDQEIVITRIDITDKINNGDFNPSQMHIVTYLQSIADETEEPTETEPQYYNSLPDIKEAAQTGKVISLYNLSQLVNNV